MESLLIFGAGGQGKVIADIAAQQRGMHKVSFLDDRFPSINQLNDWPILGKFGEAHNFLNQHSHFIVGIGNNTMRLDIITKYSQSGFNCAIISHPQSYISQSSFIGIGTVVFAQAVVGPDSKIGNGCIINTGATVDHDCLISDGVHLCPGVKLAGEVQIGKNSTIGIGSSIINKVSIGNNVIVGAGSVVTTSIGDNLTIAGAPAKIIKAND